MTKRRTLLLGALCAAFALPALAGPGVWICNRGEVGVELMRLHTDHFSTLLSWDMEGWTSIPPDRCEQISYGDGYSHLVFAVKDPNGRKVVVQYEFEKTRPALSEAEKLKELCIRQENIRDRGWNAEAKLPKQYLPPCGEGFTAAPTSATARIYGAAYLTLEVRPAADAWKNAKAPPPRPREAADPLASSDPREFLAGWYVATHNATSLAEGQRRAASMQRIVGKEAFARAVAAARAGKLQPEGLKRTSEFDPVLVRAAHNREAYMDWLATRQDPGLYAIYLIKRSTGSDWDYAAALLRARAKRLGAKTVDDAVQRVFASANATSGDCAGEPNASLADCAAQLLGPQTLWNDALDVSAAEMDRAVLKTRMLAYLGTAPQRGDAAARYARITALVSETILLAALHHQRKYGFGVLTGGERSDTKWGPFEEERRVLARFAIARDDRAFVVAAFMQHAEGDDLARLEQAVQAYRDRVAGMGEERLLSAAKAIRPKLTSGSDLGDLLERQLAPPKPSPPPPPPPPPVAEPPANEPPANEPVEEWEGVTIDGEARVRDAIHLEVSPPDALVLVRRLDQQTFVYAGKAGTFGTGGELLQLEEGVCLILIRKTGWRDRVLRLTVAAQGEATLRVALAK